MKRIVLSLAVIAATLTIVSCANGADAETTQSQSLEKEQYTCPMHPEVLSDKPGACPKCGMNLEKVEKHENHSEHHANDSTMAH